MKITQRKIAPKNWRELRFHPYSEFSEMGEGVDMDQVVADMTANGFDPNEPVIISKRTGTILDGRVRQTAAVRANIQPAYADAEGTELEELEYCNRHRLLRQNLSISQRTWYEQQVKAERDKLVPPLPSGKPQEGEPTGEQRAETAGVSARTQDYAATVMRESPAAVKEMIKKGDVAVSDAARIADEPKAIQTAAAKMVEAGEVKTLTAAAELFCPRCKRAGPSRDCKTCAVIREKARKKALKKKATAKPSKNGKVKFNDKQIDDAIGKLSRLLSERAKAFGQLKSSRYSVVRDQTNKLIAAFERWQAEKEGK